MRQLVVVVAALGACGPRVVEVPKCPAPPPVADSTVAMPAECDLTALRQQGLDAVNTGQHARALYLFEQALACFATRSEFARLAFMAACNGHDAEKSHYYFARLAPEERSRFAPICLRNGIEP